MVASMKLKMKPVEEAFKDARHWIEMSVVHKAGKGILLVQKTLLESVDVILQHGGRWEDYFSK